MKAKSSLILDSLSVASPCPVSWDSMSPSKSDNVRFCGQCSKYVYDISSMSRIDAEEFLECRSGRVCITYYQRSDGRIMTDDCPAKFRAIRKRYRQMVSFIVGLVCSLVWLPAKAQEPEMKRLMGEACVVPKKNKDSTVYDNSIYAKQSLRKLHSLVRIWVANSESKLRRGSLRVKVSEAGTVEDCVIVNTTGDTRIDSLLVKEIKKTKLAKFNGKQKFKFLLLSFEMESIAKPIES